jgi:hypothetical protein
VHRVPHTDRVETMHLATAWPSGDMSRLGLPPFVLRQTSAGLASSNSRCLRVFAENPVHSHLLEASPPSAGSLSPLL